MKKVVFGNLEMLETILYNEALGKLNINDYKNARIVIKKNWPRLPIIESEKYRYLMFITKDSSREYIDLDTIKDTHGVFVFNGKKSPLIVDMTNIETEISFYLKE